MAEQSNITVVPNDEESNEADSTFGEDEVRSYTTSLSSSVNRHVWEHGRRFHSFREGAYNFPNDESEQDRLDLNHHMCQLAMDDRLHYAPLDTSKPLRVLDLGTGTGIWAMDFADKYPNSQVIGNDLSPIQPKWVPPNASFEVDDIESPWPPRRAFDYIHARYLLGAIQDWPKLVKQAYDQLKPGAWIELQDFDTFGYTEDNSAGPDNQFLEFFKVFNDACGKIGRHGSPGPFLEGWAKDAGFINIEHKKLKIPLGIWPRDLKLRQIGALFQVNMNEIIPTALVGLLTRVEGWTPEEVDVFVARVRNDMKKKSLHLLQDYHIVWAQKPETAPGPDA